MADEAQIGLLFKQANEFSQHGRFRDALELYERITSAVPQVFEGWFNKAIVCEALRDTEGAIECYYRALDLRPNHENATRGLAIMLYNGGHWHKALYWIEKAIRSGDRHPALSELRRRCAHAVPDSPLVFISYSWADSKQVDEQILPVLRSKGVEYFIDRNRIPQGDELGELRWQIEVGIAQCDTLILVWSASASRSKYVRLELCTALAMIRHVVLCCVDDTDLPPWLQGPVGQNSVARVPIGDAGLLADRTGEKACDAGRVRAANRGAVALKETACGVTFELVPLDAGLLPNFAIGKYPVTQAQWTAVMGTNPSTHGGDVTRPVEMVSWNDVQEFMARLNAVSDRLYRLPSEVEWEFACRAGSLGNWCCGDEELMLHEFAWYVDNTSVGSEPGYAVASVDGGQSIIIETSPNKTNSVFSKRPNDWGIFHMHGNVSEWCSDDADRDSGLKVVRGGAYNNAPRFLRCAARGTFNANRGDDDLGFRVCRKI